MKQFLVSTIFCFLITITVAQIPDAELIYHKTVISVTDGKLHKNIYNEIQINNRAGEEYAKISIPFSSISKVSNILASIKGKDGRVIKKLKKKGISERSSISDFSLYEDEYIKEFTLVHNEYPYQLIYSYQVEISQFLYLSYWQPILGVAIPTKKAELLLHTPKDYKISYKNIRVDSFNMDSSGEQMQYRWELSYQNPIHTRNEIYSPPISNYLPKVLISPQEFFFDVSGSTESWISLGNWETKLLQGLSNLPESEKNKIQELIEGIEDERKKIKVLYHYLQEETRYVNVAIETGGLKPYPASYVVENRYGDCKALSNYFMSVLDYVEIPSYYCNVRAGGKIRQVYKDLPAQQFNHIILCVPVEKDTIWLDCTSDGAFDYLGSFTQNRDVFIIDKDNSHFTKTPPLQKQEVLESRKIEVSFDKNNEATAHFLNTYRGKEQEKLFSLIHNYSENRREQIIRNYYIEYGFELVDFELIAYHKDSMFTQLSYTATSNKIFNTYGEETLIKIHSLEIPLFEKPSIRKKTVQIDYPIYKVDSLMYTIPEGYQLVSFSKDEDILNDYGSYSLSFKQEEDQVIIRKTFYLKSGDYTLAEYPDFHEFNNRIRKIENNKYIIIQKQE